MNPNRQNPISPGSDSGSFEATLRLIAHAPVPEGIDERVNAALRTAPRHARVFTWPSPTWIDSGCAAGWMRAVAAAAIVVVVAGGGWGVYNHVQHQPGRGAVAPAPHPSAQTGGFSSAGAMRTPQTVKGPVLLQPQAQRPAKKHKARKRAGVTSAKPAAAAAQAAAR